MPDIMIDLETMGKRPGCVIASIGAVAFDPYGTEITNEFSRDVDMASCQDVDLTFDADTVSWWLRQPDVTREFILRTPRITLTQALLELASFVGEDSKVWSHGASFDIPILEAAYFAVGMKHYLPWSYYNIRDTRTIYAASGVSLGNLPYTVGMVPHNAMHDAIRQALAVQMAYRGLYLSPVKAE